MKSFLTEPESGVYPCDSQYVKSCRMIIFSAILSFMMSAQALDTKDLNTWRVDRETRLKAKDGWLSVVGLNWLEEGENTVGAAFSSEVRLPSGGPKNLGVIERKGRKASINFTSTEGIRLDEEPVEKDIDYSLSTDADDKYTTISYGDVKFYIIDRKNGLGVRIKDNNATARKKFNGLKWYKPVPELKSPKH